MKTKEITPTQLMRGSRPQKNVRKLDKEHAERRANFHAWRKRRGISYLKFMNAVNERDFFAPMKYQTVVSYGLRGSRPRSMQYKAIERVFPDCPILK